MGFLHSSQRSQEQIVTWAPFVQVDVQDRKSSVFNCWVPAPAWFGLLLYSSSSLQTYSSSVQVIPATLLPTTYNSHHRLFFSQVYISLRHTLGLLILLHYPPSTPWSLSEDNPMTVFAFSHGSSNPHRLPQPIPHVHCEDLISSHGMQGFCLSRTSTVNRSSSVNQPSGFGLIYLHVLPRPFAQHSQYSLQQSVITLTVSRGLCLVRSVIHPLNAVFLCPGVHDIISEMSPIV